MDGELCSLMTVQVHAKAITVGTDFTDVCTADEVTIKTEMWRSTLWLAALFVYSAVSEVALKLVDCREMGDYVAYYAPLYKCLSSYNGLQYLVFVLVAAVTAFPFVVVLNTWRHRRAGQTSQLAEPFSKPFWWWEGVLIFRRFLLNIVTILPITIAERQLLLTCACFLVLILHEQCQPFKTDRINMCETFMLGSLLLIAILTTFKHQVLLAPSKLL